MESDGDGEPMGEWCNYVVGVDQEGPQGKRIFHYDDDYGTNELADATFIAHARTDVGDLLAEIDRRGQRISELQGTLIDNIHALRMILFGKSPASGETPKQVWEWTLRDVEALVSDRDRLRDAVAGKVWEPTLEAALREALNCVRGMVDSCPVTVPRPDGVQQCSYAEPQYKCQACKHAVALLDRLSPQEPKT